ncbi:AMP-dependent synthetase/ligase [Blastopirellula marina]|uniref:AMP-dependent synthetase/ligase domain-containing protein n=1 Tax=Blastopirellula marina TaxID=124 RepID=A0A2S8GBB8_9BACT|nr:AMP-dependent synthetase/ligase [Blastopirellula marina]PQO41709.1 hypothetical protein C5Y98_03025 [Blastopirellula marina]PTL46152.1 long-chain fatty acid--CoA ligase [Blastopirellula marina]
MDTGQPRDLHNSIAGLFVERVEADLAQVALWTRLPTADASFEPSTWEQLLGDVWRMVAALSQIGVKIASRVAHYAENSRHWIVVDLALHFLGAWHVPVSLHGSQELRDAIHNHCQPEFSIFLGEHNDSSPCWMIRQGDGDQSDSLVALDELQANIPAALADDMLADLRERWASLNPDDICTLVYTSGTTGGPKGVMLTHRNLASNAIALVKTYEEKPADRRLSFLPFSHLFARTCDVYTWIARGSQLVLAASRETILADCQAMQPTLINGVPYFYQKVVEGLKQKGKLSTPGALKTALGGEIRMVTSGGAPLPQFVIDAFEKQKLLLCEGYGLTETSPVITVSTEDANRDGSVGKPLPGVEIRISETGEIETRGPHVMKGYYQDDQATQQIMDDGWLRTGDLGLIDPDGFLWITGRQKEVLVLSTGRNVSPAALELAIGSDPLVAQVIICGEGQKCLSALIVPAPDELRRRIQEAKLWVFSKHHALRHPTVRKWFRDVLDCQLANRADYEQVGPFTILGQGFTPESGEMTTKLSLRRDAILKNYQDIIHQMYQGKEVSSSWWRSLLP